MKIEYALSTGNPFGQFVVQAENDLDRIILHNFLQGRDMGYTFWLHGSCVECDYEGISSFNFGWVKPDYKEIK